MAERTLLVDVGGALLVLALALFFRAVRNRHARYGWLLRAYQLVITILVVSVPIGLLLAHVRAG